MTQQIPTMNDVIKLLEERNIHFGGFLQHYGLKNTLYGLRKRVAQNEPNVPISSETIVAYHHLKLHCPRIKKRKFKHILLSSSSPKKPKLTEDNDSTDSSCVNEEKPQKKQKKHLVSQAIVLENSSPNTSTNYLIQVIKESIGVNDSGVQNSIDECHKYESLMNSKLEQIAVLLNSINVLNEKITCNENHMIEIQKQQRIYQQSREQNESKLKLLRSELPQLHEHHRNLTKKILDSIKS